MSLSEELKTALEKHREALDGRIKALETALQEAGGDKGLKEVLLENSKGLKEAREKFELFVQQMKSQSQGDAIDRKRDSEYAGCWPNEKMAADFGRFVLAKMSPRSEVRESCAKSLVERGYTIRNDKGQFVKGDEFVKALSTQTDSSGAYLIPDEFLSSLIFWTNKYGVARQRLRKVPMGRERVSIPKGTGNLTVYYPDAGAAPTASDLSFGLVTLNAKKWAVLSYVDEELEEDAVIGIGEYVLMHMALALAIAEDTNTFRGDGTSTYGGIVGVLGSANVASVAMPATKTAFSDLTDDDLVDLKYAVEAWVRQLPDCAYYASSSIVGVLEKMTDGVGRPLYQQPTETHPLRVHGHPVIPVEVMPDEGDSAAGTKFIAFGSLMAWGALGQRRSMQLKRSTEVKFLEGQITLMAVPRQDIQETTGEAMAALKTAAA